ncbi:LysR family transcriptional regulator [Azospirillum sp. YIM B02556]|uniref:LysR family transcriptional regulator n=1 Tax=Azospirillum endophyticum TaxID=2800326 RepID=A0ABS1F4V7_9PROT|nr:LysR family transcriptional regulator [Azospirillum endophyticum]MBK1838454.1 LysR family transcriptional regulator [Azospirillum endophyticum]
MPLGPGSKQLSYFMAVLRTGSIRAAAEAGNVEPSVVSRQIASLEAELGVPLLERRGRGVVPTEAAGLVLAYCRERHSGDEALRTRLAELEGLGRGHLHIMVGEGLVDAFMDAVLIAFCERHPGVEVTVEIGGASDAVRSVAEERCHFGLAFAPPASAAVRVIRQRPQPVHAILAPDHAAADLPAPLPLSALTPFACALAAPGTGLRTLIQTAGDAEGIELRPVFIANTVAPLKRFAMAGLGVTFLSVHAVAPELASGRLVARPMANSILATSRASLIMREGRALSRAGARLLEMIDDTRFF